MWHRLLDGFTSTQLKIGLGAVTNYDSGTVYEVKYRGHYGVIGEEETQDITENWQDSGLYFEAATSLAPAVTGISPSSGPISGGTPVTITGGNFTGVTGVSFGGTPAASFTVNSDTSITVISPAGTGTVDVTVTNAYGTSTVGSGDRFTYSTNELVGWWKLGEGSGTMAADSSGYGDNGTLTNPAWSTDHPPSIDQVDNSLDFNGASSGFTAPVPTVATSNVSISAWVKWNGTTGTNYQPIAYVGNSGSDGYGLFLDNNGNLGVLCGGVVWLDTTAKLTPNTWHQVAVVGVAGSGTENWTVYLNGSQESTVSASPKAPLSSDKMIIGYAADATSPTYFPGLIDDVRVYATALTGAQVQQLAAAVPTVTGISPSSGPISGGTPVTITGGNFTGATGVSFGGTPAASFTVNSDTSITVISPAGTGTVDVTVTNAYGTSTVGSGDRFTYSTNELVGWWKLGEGSGTMAADSSGYGDNGTLTNPVWNTDHTTSIDQVGASLDFSGGNSQFTAPVPTTNTDNVSISAWVYWNGTTSISNYQPIAYNGNPWTDGYGLFLDGSGNLEVLCGGVAWLDTTARLTPNTWQQVAVVGVAGSGTENWTVYLNGSQESTVSASPKAPVSSDNMIIGYATKATSSGPTYFPGLIDDVRIYATALTATQVQQLAAITPVVQNSGISPVSATFDLNPNGTDHAAIPVTVTWNGNTLTSITNGSYTLVANTDYTVSGSTVTINTSYLDTLTVRTVNLTFNFSAGNPATLAVTVEDTTPTLGGGLVINPVSGAYSAPLTVTISDNSLSVGQSVYYSTAGDPDSVSGAIYANQMPFSFDLSTAATVYGQVYDTLTGLWGNPVSAAYNIEMATVPVTGVSLDKTSDIIGVNGKDTVTATISPSGATNQNVIWSSDAPSVATVAGNGLTGAVTGVATGTAHIKVTTVDGAFSKTCTVTVITPPLVSTSGAGTVSNVTGGIVKQGSAASVIIPASALGSADTTVTVESAASPPAAPTGDTVVGAYEFTVNGGGYSFSTPVALTFTFPAGTTNPAVYYYDTSASRWVLVTGGTVNGDTITVTVNHFTTFAVIAETQPTTTNYTGGAPPALALTTASLAGGTVGQSYKETIMTNNEGTAPYTFAVTSGSLPSGLSLDAATGVIGGAPTAAGVYTFTVTAKDVNGKWANESYTMTVNHATAPPSTQPVTLKDIAGNWAYAGIEKLVSMGAITGYPDGTFRPNNDITRAEFVTVLVKALQLAPKTGPVFADTGNSWAKAYISTAAAYGIVSGYDASHFGPNDLITREQMTAMVVRAAKLSPVSGELTFKDTASIDPWARGYVVTAVKDGIISGYPPPTSGGYPTFRPLAYATRAEAATVIAGIAK